MKKRIILKESDIVRIVKNVLKEEWMEYPPEGEPIPYIYGWLPGWFAYITKEEFEELQKSDKVRKLELDPDSDPESNDYSCNAEIYFSGDLYPCDEIRDYHGYENEELIHKSVIETFHDEFPEHFEARDFSDYWELCQSGFEYKLVW